MAEMIKWCLLFIEHVKPLRSLVSDCIVTLAALRRGISDALALWSPRWHRSLLDALERKTLVCLIGRRHAHVDVIVVVPGDNNCIVTVDALRHGVLDALALRSHRRYQSPLGARGRKTLL